MFVCLICKLCQSLLFSYISLRVDVQLQKGVAGSQSGSRRRAVGQDGSLVLASEEPIGLSTELSLPQWLRQRSPRPLQPLPLRTDSGSDEVPACSSAPEATFATGNVRRQNARPLREPSLYFFLDAARGNGSGPLAAGSAADGPTPGSLSRSLETSPTRCSLDSAGLAQQLHAAQQDRDRALALVKDLKVRSFTLLGKPSLVPICPPVPHAWNLGHALCTLYASMGCLSLSWHVHLLCSACLQYRCKA
jgi:hypothetical protein